MAEQVKDETKVDDAAKQKADADTGKAAPDKSEVTLEELLAQWPADDAGKTNDDGKPAKADDGAVTQPDTNDIRKFMSDWQKTQAKTAALHAELEDDRVARNQQDLVKMLKKAVPDLKDHDDDLVLDLSLGEWRRNPDLERAYEARRSNPSGWKKVVEAIGTKIAGKLPKKVEKDAEDGAADDAADTTDAATRQLAARAAGRTTTTSRKPDPAKEEDERAMAMTPGEFAQHVFGQTRIRI